MMMVEKTEKGQVLFKKYVEKISKNLWMRPASAVLRSFPTFVIFDQKTMTMTIVVEKNHLVWEWCRLFHLLQIKYS